MKATIDAFQVKLKPKLDYLFHSGKLSVFGRKEAGCLSVLQICHYILLVTVEWDFSTMALGLYHTGVGYHALFQGIFPTQGSKPNLLCLLLWQLGSLPLVPPHLPPNQSCDRDVCELKLLSHVQLLATPWTVAHQAPLSKEFFRQGDWSGLPFPSPGDLPNPGIEPGFPKLQADALPSESVCRHYQIFPELKKKIIELLF